MTKGQFKSKLVWCYGSIVCFRVFIAELICCLNRSGMRKAALQEKIEALKSAVEYEHKLIDSIHSIMSMKRKAEYDYQLSLENVNRELEKYISSENGFLTDIVKSYQSYVTVIYHNQKTLIEGYDNEILTFLKGAKDNRLEDTILNKISKVDQELRENRQKIQQYKRLIKENYEELQIVDSEYRLGEKFKPLSEEVKRQFANKYNDLLELKRQNEECLEMHIDTMMNISMLHDETLLELEDYENVYLQKKANDVFDNFMRAFVLEVSYIRSLQFDMGTILQKVKERQQEQRKIGIQELRSSMKKDKSKIGSFIYSTYKKFTQNPEFDIKEHYISPRVRQKWERVCEYYNEAH